MIKQTNQISIVIADDHELLRDGFRVMLKKYPDIKLLGEAENGKSLIDLVQKVKPDVVLTDIKMPEMDGIEATRMLLKKNPGIRIIALSMFDEENLIIDMLEAGARGYLLKNSHKDEIMDAIRLVHYGQTFYCKTTSAKLVSMIAKSKFNPHKKTPAPDFTEREIQIIKLVCEQLSNKEIADRLNLSVRTIEGYREKIQEKMEVKNTAGIVVYAIKKSIFQIS